jgi:hypothetical protein
MLSGTGHAEHLKAPEIPAVANPPVGDNLQGHIYSDIYFKISPIPDDTKTVVNSTLIKLAEFLQDSRSHSVTWRL